MSRRQKGNLYRIIIATVLFVGIALIPVEGVAKALLFLVPYIIVGYDVLYSAARNILSGKVFDENFLMALATVGAFGIGEYPEAVFVMLFYQIGELFQSIAVGKSRKAITELMDICPEVAHVLRNGEVEECMPEEIEVGDIILVKPGEKIPVDAVVEKGSSDIDTSNMTGESLPRFVKEGDKVISGCVNLSSPVEIRAEKEFGESTVSKILELVEHSAMSKGKYENFITRFARVYTPVVVILALLVAFVPPLFLGNLTEWIMKALSFLVVSCPCALVISVPLTFFAGIGTAGRFGVLIKGSTYLELLEKCNVILTDKTGTITEGRLFVTDIIGEKDTVLTLAAGLERFSNHPISRAITDCAKEYVEAENVKEIPGRGITGTVGGKIAIVGNAAFMQENGINLPDADRTGSRVYVALDGEYMGEIAVADKVKESAKKALDELKDLGIKRTVMLTGDGESGAQAVCESVGINEVYHSLLPQDKVIKAEKIIEENEGTTVYLGDGVNDAPVLKRADVGIAMGSLGSDAAIEASDIVFMNDDIALLPKSIKLARKTMKIVRENIIFSIGVKVGVLVLTLFGLTNMWQAVFADVGVMVIAVLNSLRVMR